VKVAATAQPFFECCYLGDATNHCPEPHPEESCIPGVGCRCSQTGVKLNRTHRVTDHKVLLAAVAANGNFICDLLKNEEMEKKAVDLVCTKLTQEHYEMCEPAITFIWSALAKKECPDGNSQDGEAIPPRVCKFVQNEEIEKVAVSVICSKQHKVPAEECEMVLTKAWDALSKKECANMVTAEVVPPMICKLVENQMLEKKVLDEICSKEHKMPTTECEAALTKLWDVISQKECPKVELTAIPPMVCKLAKLPELEKTAVDVICSKQHKVPAAECEEVLTKAWDDLVKKECPDKVEITSETKPCCEGHCVDSSKAKYYSVAKSMTGKKHCGECCMDPKKYNLFHAFEKNLTKADNDSPCKVFGYTVYDSTDTHGFGPVSMTLDLYNQPDSDAIVV